MNYSSNTNNLLTERAAKIVEQQERERPAQKQASPRAGTPVGALMGVPSPSTMGMINQTMSPGNPSHKVARVFHNVAAGNREAGLMKTVTCHYKFCCCRFCIFLFISSLLFALSLVSYMKLHDIACLYL